MQENYSITVCGSKIDRGWFSEREAKYLFSLPRFLPSLQWVWEEIYSVRDSYGKNNAKAISEQQNGANVFYGQQQKTGHVKTPRPSVDNMCDSLTSFQPKSVWSQDK